LPLDDGQHGTPPAGARTAPDPEAIAIAGEEYAAILLRMETELSTRERRALLLSVAGNTTAEIAACLGCAPKAAENALARARRKLKGS
ncbi:MAG: sigma factor-like helix-turn-helix DNA-binding protein, partial [Gemmiger sp.]|nr:sigma factor-like helix-turn-helix DNA-binding protein [Gemmiger sp.]